MNSRDPNASASLADAAIPDVQRTLDTRQMPIQGVGVRSVKYPLVIRRHDGVETATVAEFEMTVFLPADQKGTHMSRFIALLEELEGAIDIPAFSSLLLKMAHRLEAPSGKIIAKFPYFVSKVAPVSGVVSLMDYQVTLEGEVSNGTTCVWLTVLVPVTSLCPCSKKISDYGAHNQRSHVTVRAQLKEAVAFETLIKMIEEEASCELYGLLKRPDEKYVTERAYDNPKFVEDLVRDIALRLNSHPAVGHYVLEAENFESIHNHSAFARIERS
ncbi:MAG: GTP cyclohydrolase FolE2 [Burkholderiales bacterium]|jgi:GTP cyclohydrolase I|nr:GTP cyclohydrolase FolE2 [Burkholderiales bacterium]